MDVYLYIRSKMDKNQKWTRIKNRQDSKVAENQNVHHVYIQL